MIAFDDGLSVRVLGGGGGLPDEDRVARQGLPASISKSTVPNAYTSVRVSHSSPAACSGAM